MKLFMSLILLVASFAAANFDACKNGAEGDQQHLTGYVRMVHLNKDSDLMVWVEDANNSSNTVVIVYPTWPSDISSKGRFTALTLYALDNNAKLSFDISTKTCFEDSSDPNGLIKYYPMSNVYLKQAGWRE